MATIVSLLTCACAKTPTDSAATPTESQDGSPAAEEKVHGKVGEQPSVPVEEEHEVVPEDDLEAATKEETADNLARMAKFADKCLSEPLKSPRGSGWSFIVAADTHDAEPFVELKNKPAAYRERIEERGAAIAQVRKYLGGDLLIIPGDSNSGHWTGKSFRQKLDPALSPRQAILTAGRLVFGGYASALRRGGYSANLVAAGDHEVGDNPWKPGSEKSELLPAFRQAFGAAFTLDARGRFRYPAKIGAADARPVGTEFEETAYAYRHKNAVFITVDPFYQQSPDKELGPHGSVSAEVQGKQLAWVESVLQAARADQSIEHIFVQSHLPAVHPVKKVASSGMMLRGHESSSLWELMKKYEVDIYFAGEMHAPTVNPAPGTRLFQVVARGGNFKKAIRVDVEQSGFTLREFDFLPGATQSGTCVYKAGSVSLKASSGAVLKGSGTLKPIDKQKPALHWSFDEGKQAKDAFRFNNHGELGSQYRLIGSNPPAKGKCNSGLSLKKMTEFSARGLLPFSETTPFSMSFWAKTESSKRTILFMASNTKKHSPDHIAVTASSNGINLVTSGSAKGAKWKAQIADGKWHHLTFIHGSDGGRFSDLKLVLDGKLIGKPERAASDVVYVNPSLRPNPGGHGVRKEVLKSVGGTPMSGSLDEFKLWGRGISPAEAEEAFVECRDATPR